MDSVLPACSRPPFLQPGDLVAIAAPARKVTPEDLAPAVNLFQSWGLTVRLPESLFDADCQFAGPDDVRTRLFQQLLDDDQVRAIVCAKGGYGSVRIIDRIDFTHFTRCPKWVVGYSDVTVFHSHIHRHCGIQTIHATMPLNIPADAAQLSYPATDTLFNALFGLPMSYRFTGHNLNRQGVGEGPLVGGNLSILYSLCGSSSAIDTRGKVLFIEDLDEYLYHIDRMIQNLKRNGVFAGLVGLVVGQMSDMHDNAVPFGHTPEEIILEAVAEYGYPVCFDFPAGHIGSDNCALPMGGIAHLEVGSEVNLTMLQ